MIKSDPPRRQTSAEKLAHLDSVLSNPTSSDTEVLAALYSAYEAAKPKDKALEVMANSVAVHTNNILIFFHGDNNFQNKNQYTAKLLFLASQKDDDSFYSALYGAINFLEVEGISIDSSKIYSELQRLFLRQKNSAKTTLETNVWLSLAERLMGASQNPYIAPKRQDAARTCANTIKKELETKPSSPFGASTRTL